MSADAQAEAEVTRGEARRPAVLVVDDVPANLIAMKALLDGVGCEVVSERSGADALRRLAQRDFAVVLLDVQMPEMDGYEVSRRLRSDPVCCDVPIIFLTASNPSEENQLRGYDSGAVDFLFKPINPFILRGKVKVFLELYQSRRQIADAKAALERRNRELEAFSYSVSHDLRAPLRSIDGFSQALAEDFSEVLGEQGNDYLRRVRAAAQRMARLIDDLLLLARVSRAEPSRSDVDLGELSRAIVRELQHKENQRAVTVVIADGLVAHADPGLMRILLENLLGNAWKFTAKAADARIEVGALRQGASVVYFVRDNGAGFNMAYAGQLFRPFRRLHSEADFPGTGIGLATVHRIVEHHGGRVWAEGGVGKGAVIFFTLGPASEREPA